MEEEPEVHAEHSETMSSGYDGMAALTDSQHLWFPV